jgi:hypothetical protein
MTDLSRAFPADSDVAILLSSIKCELAQVYGSQPSVWWRPLTRRTDLTHFGRKRRARRARGRRIEAKRAFLKSLAQRLEPLARGLLAHEQTLLSFGIKSEQEARADFMSPSLMVMRAQQKEAQSDD